MRTCPLNSSSFLSWLRLIWMVGEALDVGGGDSDRAASYQEQIVSLGVKLRRTQCEQMFSGLPLKADIAQCSWHVSKVPDSGNELPLYSITSSVVARIPIHLPTT